MMVILPVLKNDAIIYPDTVMFITYSLLSSEKVAQTQFVGRSFLSAHDKKDKGMSSSWEPSRNLTKHFQSKVIDLRAKLNDCAKTYSALRNQHV